ncbi:MAG: hypothetical protein IJ830_04860 [Alphaproteobacteria bacterium]|nr:hypothetical protein [Alphaproteobacteria bacterium]
MRISKILTLCAYGAFWSLNTADVLAGDTSADPGVWDKTKEVTSDVWDGTKEVTSDVWDGTKEVTSDVWDGAKEVGSDIKDGITDDDKTTTHHSSPAN